MPLMTPELEPVPAQLRTCTATIVAPVATPYCVPPMVDAQCVPWPLHESPYSDVMMPSYCHDEPHVESVPLVQPADHPPIARPPKSLWPMRTPVSRTYTLEPAPVAEPISYEPSVPERESMRSMPQLPTLRVVTEEPSVMLSWASADEDEMVGSSSRMMQSASILSTSGSSRSSARLSLVRCAASAGIDEKRWVIVSPRRRVTETERIVAELVKERRTPSAPWRQ